MTDLLSPGGGGMTANWRTLTLEEKTQEIMRSRGVDWHTARSILGRAAARARKQRTPRSAGPQAIAAKRGPRVLVERRYRADIDGSVDWGLLVLIVLFLLVWWWAISMYEAAPPVTSMGIEPGEMHADPARGACPARVDKTDRADDRVWPRAWERAGSGRAFFRPGGPGRA